MLPNPIWRVVEAVFVISVFPDLGIHVSANRVALQAGKKGARPAEVGALASVFEKSATELKQSKLLKCKQTLQIATFNVRTLNRIGQLPELIASAEEHKIDIICIQEHRYMHTEDINYHETAYIYIYIYIYILLYY